MDLGEEIGKGQISGKCRAARLPAQVTAEVLSDYAWAIKAKNLISQGAAELSAQELNSGNVPKAAKPWAMIAVGGLQIGAGHFRILRRLDQLIALAGQAPAAPEDPKK